MEHSAAVDLQVRIPPVLELKLERHPAHVQVTAADIGRGELVVRGPRVHVAANDRRGFVLQVELADTAFSGYEVEGFPSPATVGASGNRYSADVAYRLRLPPGALPGEYRWPLTVSLHHP